MSKPYTDDDLAYQVTADFNWRLRELSDLKTAVKRADRGSQSVLMRALITVSYAHWEGFIRFTARKYMQHISMRRFAYSLLQPQFYRNYFLPRLGALSASRANIADRCKLIDDLLGSRENTFSTPNDDLVETRANLNFAVYSDICLICGFDASSLGADEMFLDVFLLKRRNNIAHGEDTFVGVEDLDRLVDETMGHMRAFKDAVENAAVLKSYRAA